MIGSIILAIVSATAGLVGLVMGILRLRREKNLESAAYDMVQMACEEDTSESGKEISRLNELIGKYAKATEDLEREVKSIRIPKKTRDSILRMMESRKLVKKFSPKKAESVEKTKDEGSVSLTFLLVIVPSIIMLILAGTFAYVIAYNANNSNYSTPSELLATLTAFLGYLSGFGASAAIRK